MSLYRHHFAAVSEFFYEGSTQSWEQRAPMIGDSLSVSTALIGETNIPKHNGLVQLSLLGDNCTNLDTPLDVSYRLDGESFKGIIFSRDTHISLSERANTIHFTDVNSDVGSYNLSFLIDDIVVEHDATPELCCRVITAISAFMCEKAVRLEAHRFKQSFLEAI